MIKINGLEHKAPSTSISIYEEGELNSASTMLGTALVDRDIVGMSFKSSFLGSYTSHISMCHAQVHAVFLLIFLICEINDVHPSTTRTSAHWRRSK